MSLYCCVGVKVEGCSDAISYSCDRYILAKEVVVLVGKMMHGTTSHQPLSNISVTVNELTLENIDYISHRGGDRVFLLASLEISLFFNFPLKDDFQI